MIFISPLAKCLVVDFHLTFNLRSHISLSVQHLCCHCWDHGNSYWNSLLKGQPWSYGSWIYNYLCNQCLSPTKVWIRIPLMARCTRYNIMWKCLSVNPVSSTNKSDRHDRDEILLTVALNTVLYPPWLKFFLILQIYLQYSFNWLIYCV